MEISQHNMTSVTNILGVTQDETMAVEISQHQFSLCQEANGQFCNVYAPLQPLANLHLASQPYMPRMQLSFPPDVHYKSGKLKASVYPHKLHQM